MEPTEEALNYADSKINELEKNKSKESEDKYKKLDKNIVFFCIIGIFLGIILVILNSYMGPPPLINVILNFIGIFLLIFSGIYIILTLVIRFLQLFIRKLSDNFKANMIFKLIATTTLSLICIIFILSSIPCLGCNSNINPTNASKNLLLSQINNSGAESCTDTVTFTRSKSLFSGAITSNTGLDKEQIYFDNPESITNFETDNNTLRYTANNSKKVKMCIICSSEKENLMYAINANKKVNDQFRELPTTLLNGETVCVIYPRKAT